MAYKLTGNENKSKEIQDRIEKRMIANQQALSQVGQSSAARSALIASQPQIVRIDLNILGKRNLKKRSLLEEILKSSRSSNAGKLLKLSLCLTFDYLDFGGMQQSSSTHLPIIIIPGSVLAGNLCLLNAKSFLQDGSYTVLNPTQQSVTNGKERLVVEHKIGNEKVLFEVHDSVTSFTD